MVSIDEIAANFVFGERFRGESARQVTRLNASWRADGLPLYCAPQAEKRNA